MFPAGPPAAILLYTLCAGPAARLAAGQPRPRSCDFLLPDVGARPELGRITGRGNTANLEAVLG